MGLSLQDFCACTPLEFQQAWQAWNEWQQAQTQTSWEQSRMLATIILQPYSKKSLKPADVFRLPWDKKPEKGAMPDTADHRHLTREQRQAEMKAIMSEWNGIIKK